MQLVERSSGRYAVRRLTLLGWEYNDLENEEFWWTSGDKYIKDCLGNYNTANNRYLKLTAPEWRVVSRKAGSWRWLWNH